MSTAPRPIFYEGSSQLSSMGEVELMGTNTAEKAVLAGSEILPERNQAHESLPNEKSRWQNVVENSAVGIAVADLTGRFVAANTAYQKMLGYTEEELRALKFLGLTEENKLGANGALVGELLAGRRQQFQIEKCYRHKNGNVTWIRNHLFLVPSVG